MGDVLFRIKIPPIKKPDNTKNKSTPLQKRLEKPIISLDALPKGTIAMFLYDNNKNGASDLNSFGAFANSAFLKFVDFYVPATTPQTNTFYLNGRVLKSRNWPSKTNGVSVIVFD